nr:class I SAM-dependent methyltransferase [Paenibacillus sp. MER 99-2]
MIQNNVNVNGKPIVDIGCGGGIYTKSLADMGALHVTGVDLSLEMIKGASENCINYDNVVFDRTPEDCLMPGNESHLRGYFFEKYCADHLHVWDPDDHFIFRQTNKAGDL